ncbi:polysaccharide biosynthesis tyrosine autokinase [Elioraea sp.]|uniref:GumC family protein n=1 Tax=Elioraea sp. TaxID=2185103 RepID=UPI0025C3C27C|nr:polysaccharide biosynthesis tyrosine autokinase [Elioraea sp.]
MLNQPTDIAPDGGSRRPQAGYGYPPTVEPVGGLSPAALLAVLRRRKWAMILAVIFFPALAVVALNQLTPRFTGTAAVIYEAQEFAIRELQSIVRDEGGTNSVVLASQLEIIKSLSMAERLADRLNLASRPEFNWYLAPQSNMSRTRDFIFRQLSRGAGFVSAEWAAQLAPRPRVAPRPEDLRVSVTLSAMGAIGATVIPGSRVINISFTSQSQGIAQTGANILAELYINDQLEQKFEAVRRANTWLEQRVTQLRQEVLDAEDRIEKVRAQAGLVRGVNSNLLNEQISRLQTDLITAQSELATQEGRLSQARGARGPADLEALASVIGAGTVASLRGREAQARAELAQLRNQYGDRHPDVQRKQAELNGILGTIGVEISRVGGALESDARATRVRIQSLQEALARTQAQLVQSGEAEIQVRALEREAEAARGLLQAVLARTQQTVQQTAIEKPDARVLSPATWPGSPSWPRRTLILAASVMLGLIFGAALVWLLEIADSTFRSGDEIRTVLGLPCFALIPSIRRGLGRAKVEDYVVRKPVSAFSESLRSLRAALWLGATPPKCIVITAARPDEGKTTTAITLGRTAALNGEKVMVIDCDIRQPSFDRILKTEGSQGIADYLLGHAPLSAVKRRDALTPMEFIPAGAAETNSSGLFMADAMGALLDQLRRDYDLIVLDAPPTLAMADARIIARLADATVLCVRWRDTPQSVVRSTLDMLEDAKARVVGAVMTRVDAKAHSRSGYSDAEVYHPRYGGYFRE